jgi:hypothetical protein
MMLPRKMKAAPDGGKKFKAPIVIDGAGWDLSNGIPLRALNPAAPVD